MANDPPARGSHDRGSPQDPDLDLVARFRAGERGAFDDLVRRYQDSVNALVRRYVKSEDDAREVTQKAFVRAFERIDTFRGESSFGTWVHRIGINFALNHIRGQDRHEPLEDDLRAFTNSLGTERLVAAEMWRKVHARLAELAPKQRLVVELRLFHELSFREVAVLADCSEDSARVTFHQAVKRLRSLIPGLTP
jgi:RNA polymerase sigma-70 factor (ECF subfamily)